VNEYKFDGHFVFLYNGGSETDSILNKLNKYKVVTMNIDQNISVYKEDIKKHRRNLHKIPEAGFEESKTSEYVYQTLKDMGMTVEKYVAKTGVVGFIQVDEDLPSIAFRSDMDALSMTEETGLEFQSEHEGFMHGCGHDGHMATLLIFARFINTVKENLKVNVLFIFQPAEEGPGGAEVMLKEGLFEKYNVKEVYGLHLYPEVEEGRIAVRPGPLMAQTGEFDIDVIGKSGHGALPHKGLDAIIIAADLLQRFQTIISREICPIDPAVLTVGRMAGGERRNIIAENVRLEGTVRAFDEDIFQSIFDSMERHIKATEIAYGCAITYDFRTMYPPVYNDETLTQSFMEANQDVVDLIEPQMIAEDFSYFQKAAPGVFFFVGTHSTEKGFTFPLHNAKFNFDETTLLNGVQAYKNILVHRGYLKGVE